MAATKIEWTDETWDTVTGCTKISRGCKNCYMYREYPRRKVQGVRGYEPAPDVVQLLPKRLEIPRRWRKLRRVFVNSMSDTFHERVPDHFIRWMFQSMRFAVQKGHVFQLLTKRPEGAAEWWGRYESEDLRNEGGEPEWPAGIWMGTSVESQDYAEERLEHLARIPAPVRFVSAEPLLGQLNLRKWLGDVVKWVIVGGESSPRARPMEESWVLNLLEQYDNANVPAFLKQLGGRASKRGGDQAVINGRTWRGMPAFPERVASNLSHEGGQESVCSTAPGQVDEIHALAALSGPKRRFTPSQHP